MCDIWRHSTSTSCVYKILRIHRLYGSTKNSLHGLLSAFPALTLASNSSLWLTLEMWGCLWALRSLVEKRGYLQVWKLGKDSGFTPYHPKTLVDPGSGNTGGQYLYGLLSSHCIQLAVLPGNLWCTPRALRACWKHPRPPYALLEAVRQRGRRQELLIERGSKAGGWGEGRIQGSGSARLQGHSILQTRFGMGCVAGGLSLKSVSVSGTGDKH